MRGDGWSRACLGGYAAERREPPVDVNDEPAHAERRRAFAGALEELLRAPEVGRRVALEQHAAEFVLGAGQVGDGVELGQASDRVLERGDGFVVAPEASQEQREEARLRAVPRNVGPA